MAPEMGVCGNPEWSPDGKRISFTFTTPTLPKDLYVIAVESGEKEQLTYSMPAGNFEERLVVPEKVRYKSTDGYEINAYLYKPREIGAGEKFPGMVWIHGGPTGQYEEMFQHQNQSSEPSLHFFVQNGYVILQPNIRGSSGYGKAFEKANNKCWGKCDLEDVLAGAEYLKSLPYVNGDKMVVCGRSYGGMLTMAAVTNAPGVFQAAIAESGHEDWTHEAKDFDYELGPLPENYQLRWELSPVNHVKNVTTPIFVIHGEGRGPSSTDSKSFVEELRKYNKTFLYKSYLDEGYYVHGVKNRRQMLLDKLEFLDQYLNDKVASK
jgi:dipeptidyl aminopeptidase/acylaminoacyl peptidase